MGRFGMKTEKRVNDGEEKKVSWKLATSHTQKRDLTSAIGALIVLASFLFKQFKLDPTLEKKQHLERALEVHDNQELLYQVTKRQIGYGTLQRLNPSDSVEQQRNLFIQSTSDLSYLATYEVGVSTVLMRGMPFVSNKLQQTRRELLKAINQQDDLLGQYQSVGNSVDPAKEPELVIKLRVQSIKLRDAQRR